jgi:hypothetical protein
MKTHIDCIPCLVKQALNAVQLAGADELLQEQALRDILIKISRMDMSASPPEMGAEIHRLVRKMTGRDDPYSDLKDRYNRFAMDAYPRFKQLIAASPNPLETAVRLAIAGNIIDFGANLEINQAVVDRTIEASLTAVPFGDIKEFFMAVSNAEKILYLADNTGEIVFDRLLIEEIGPDRVTVAVRGGPVINDATMDDARFCGLTDMVDVVDNGADIPGTILDACSDSFIRSFQEADLIVSKGQGNYETLSETSVNRNVYFLFKTKCTVAARDIGCEVGRLVARKIIADTLNS